MPSIISTILGVESGGGNNVTQGNIGDINNATGDLAQGYFQITGATWKQFGGLNTGFSSAIQAPYGTQLEIAQNIPSARWGPNTQSALIQAGYIPRPGETLGQMLKRYGENPSATVPADQSSTANAGGGPFQTTPVTFPNPLGSLGSALSGAASGVVAFISNIFIRAALILLGLILIWQGLAMMRGSNVVEQTKVVYKTVRSKRAAGKAA